MTNASRTDDSSLGSFFRYHGWLSPGVRLFRQLGFPTKAALIALMFVLPLLAMLWFLWSGAEAQLTSTHNERDGVRYVQPLLQLVKAAQGRRQAAMDRAADLGAWQAQVTEAFGQVERQQQALGARFGTADAFAALAKAQQSLAQAPAAADADAAYAAHTAFIDKALDLMRVVANGAELALDPQLDTYHLMTYAVLLGPRQYENFERLHVMGKLVLQSQQMPASRRDVMTRGHAMLDFIDLDIEASYHQGIVQFPEVARQLDMAGADAAAEAFATAVNQQILGAAPSGDPAAFDQLGRAVVERQQVLAGQVLARLDARLQQRATEIRHTLTMQLGLSLLCLAIAFYMMLSFYRVMMGGIREVAAHLELVTQGNLATMPRPWGHDEAAQLMIKMGEMEASLRRFVGQVVDSAASVRTASSEIASASMDLSGRTETNAASLQQTASSMAQISSAVKHTAETVAGAIAIAQANAASAERGGVVIGRVVDTMEGIRTASSRIGEIINVIDGIAFQTNILALNAAVEAARAGEHGRGFAVVASEVRALAGRSAVAAKEVKTLIGASIEQVESGNRVVADAGATIQEIVANASRIDRLMNEIADASQEQRIGVDRVGGAVHELDQSTQQNAALVEQTAAASGSLAEQAERLAAGVAFFKIH
jgi:methyl-accepting chemotaxis protein